MLFFDATSLDGKHVDAKHMVQCLVAESRHLVMQLVSHGPAFTATKSSVHRDCQKESPFDPQILGCAPEVLELQGLRSAPSAACCIQISMSRSSDRVGTN